MGNEANKRQKDSENKTRDAYSEIQQDPMEGNADEQDLLEQADEAATASYILDNGVEGDESHQLKPDTTKKEKKKGIKD